MVFWSEKFLRNKLCEKEEEDVMKKKKKNA